MLAPVLAYWPVLGELAPKVNGWTNRTYRLLLVPAGWSSADSSSEVPTWRSWITRDPPTDPWSTWFTVRSVTVAVMPLDPSLAAGTSCDVLLAVTSTTAVDACLSSLIDAYSLARLASVPPLECPVPHPASARARSSNETMLLLIAPLVAMECNLSNYMVLAQVS